jgi:hypothetical protein
MRLHEFTSEEEWQRLEQLIYASTYKALAAYQQQRATSPKLPRKQRRWHVKPSAYPMLHHPVHCPSPTHYPKLRQRLPQRIALSKLLPHCHPPHVLPWQKPSYLHPTSQLRRQSPTPITLTKLLAACCHLTSVGQTPSTCSRHSQERGYRGDRAFFFKAMTASIMGLSARQRLCEMNCLS